MSSKSTHRPSVIIFGAGIAGLSTAHHLCDRGYSVLVVEALDIPGGLARSERIAEDHGVPSEYSWRGFGPWYHNTFRVMKEILVLQKTGTVPHLFSQSRSSSSSSSSPSSISTPNFPSVYTEELSRPIDWILTPNVVRRKDGNVRIPLHQAIRMTPLDKARVLLLALYAWSASRERSVNEYATINAAQWLRDHISPVGASTLSWIFGPWVGVDASRASIHHVAGFFLKNIAPGPAAPYSHPPIRANTATKQIARPKFTQGGLSGWLILRRPSNEAWFDPWVQHLKSKGVTFMFGTSLKRLNWNATANRVVSATVERPGNATDQQLVGDYYVLAINPFDTRTILSRSPELQAACPTLAMFDGLVAGGPHTQIAFSIGFPEEVRLPGIETAVILVDSEYDITLYSQDQLFHPDTNLGRNVVSLWSGTATIDSVPGALYDKRMTELTKDEFKKEILHQLFQSEGLDQLVQEANGGRSLASFPISHFNVWHTWKFPTPSLGTGDIAPSPDKVSSTHPKWVNDTENIAYQPPTTTSVANLFLAGAHTQTGADLYSMEGAVESGKRAANAIIVSDKQKDKKDNTPPVLHNTPNAGHTPALLRPLQKMDGWLYSHGMPHVLNVMGIFGLVGALFLFMWRLRKARN